MILRVSKKDPISKGSVDSNQHLLSYHCHHLSALTLLTDRKLVIIH